MDLAAGDIDGAALAPAAGADARAVAAAVGIDGAAGDVDGADLAVVAAADARAVVAAVGVHPTAADVHVAAVVVRAADARAVIRAAGLDIAARHVEMAALAVLAAADAGGISTALGDDLAAVNVHLAAVAADLLGGSGIEFLAAADARAVLAAIGVHGAALDVYGAALVHALAAADARGIAAASGRQPAAFDANGTLDAILLAAVVALAAADARAVLAAIGGDGAAVLYVFPQPGVVAAADARGLVAARRDHRTADDAHGAALLAVVAADARALFLTGGIAPQHAAAVFDLFIQVQLAALAVGHVQALGAGQRHARTQDQVDLAVEGHALVEGHGLAHIIPAARVAAAVQVGVIGIEGVIVFPELPHAVGVIVVFALLEREIHGHVRRGHGEGAHVLVAVRHGRVAVRHGRVAVRHGRGQHHGLGTLLIVYVGLVLALRPGVFLMDHEEPGLAAGVAVDEHLLAHGRFGDGRAVHAGVSRTIAREHIDGHLEGIRADFRNHDHIAHGHVKLHGDRFAVPLDRIVREAEGFAVIIIGDIDTVEMVIRALGGDLHRHTLPKVGAAHGLRQVSGLADLDVGQLGVHVLGGDEERRGQALGGVDLHIALLAALLHAVGAQRGAGGFVAREHLGTLDQREFALRKAAPALEAAPDGLGLIGGRALGIGIPARDGGHRRAQIDADAAAAAAAAAADARAVEAALGIDRRADDGHLAAVAAELVALHGAAVLAAADARRVLAAVGIDGAAIDGDHAALAGAHAAADARAALAATGSQLAAVDDHRAAEHAVAAADARRVVAADRLHLAAVQREGAGPGLGRAADAGIAGLSAGCHQLAAGLLPATLAPDGQGAARGHEYARAHRGGMHVVDDDVHIAAGDHARIEVRAVRQVPARSQRHPALSLIGRQRLDQGRDMVGAVLVHIERALAPLGLQLQHAAGPALAVVLGDQHVILDDQVVAHRLGLLVPVGVVVHDPAQQVQPGGRGEIPRRRQGITAAPGHGVIGHRAGAVARAEAHGQRRAQYDVAVLVAGGDVACHVRADEIVSGQLFAAGDDPHALARHFSRHIHLIGAVQRLGDLEDRPVLEPVVGLRPVDLVVPHAGQGGQLRIHAGEGHARAADLGGVGLDDVFGHDELAADDERAAAVPGAVAADAAAVEGRGAVQDVQTAALSRRGGIVPARGPVVADFALLQRQLAAVQGDAAAAGRFVFGDCQAVDRKISLVGIDAAALAGRRVFVDGAAGQLDRGAALQRQAAAVGFRFVP